MMDDKIYAQKIGNNGRKTAIRLFGKKTIKEQWINYLTKYGYNKPLISDGQITNLT